MRRRNPFALPTALALLAAACSGGDEPANRPAGALARWSAPTSPIEPATGAATVEALAPCRVRFVVEIDGSDAEVIDERPLPAAGVLRAEWSALPAASPPTVTPPETDAAAGRTEGRLVAVQVGWADAGRTTRATTVWTSPGQGKDLARLERPPPVPEDLDAGARLELVTVAVAESATGARLVPSPKGSHAVGEDGGAPLRAVHVRAWLEVVAR